MSRSTTTAGRFATCLAAVVGFVWFACGPQDGTVTAPQDQQISVQQLLEPAMSVQESHTPELLGRPGVVGTATGLDESGQPLIIIFTESANVTGLPERLDGYGVRVVASGRFYALQGGPPCENPPCGGGRAPKLTDHWPSPVPIGVSISNDNECAAGTFGAVVLMGGQRFVLSNNHVMARENDASVGEPIVQPGRYDNKPKCADEVSTEQLATLEQAVDLQFGAGSNTMDAALAAPVSGVTLSCSTPPGFYGFPSSTTVTAAIGMAIQKVGRTSRLTTGVVTAVNATVTVVYSSGDAEFVGQIVTSSHFSRSGDSGALVVTNDGSRNPVGLLFAAASNGITILNPIDDVLAAFGGASICDS